MHRRETEKMVQMFSCGGVIHSRKSWSVKLVWWLHRPCRRGIWLCIVRTPSVACSLAVLAQHWGCQSKHLFGAMKVWDIAVWEGKHFQQHWDSPGERHTQIWPSSVLPGVCMAISDPIFLFSIWIIISERNGRMRCSLSITEKLQHFQYILTFPRVLCKLFLALMEI